MPDPLEVVLVGAELGAERDDEPVVPRVDVVRVALVDPEDVDVEAALLEPGLDQPGRGRLLVLDHERAAARDRLTASSIASPPGPPRARARPRPDVVDGPAKRSTISVSSSSLATNGGAKRVWSPAKPSRVGWVESVTRPALERGGVDLAGHAELGRQERLAVVARVRVLDAEQEAVAAHLVDERGRRGGPPRARREAAAALADVLDEALTAKGVDDGEADRAGERGAVPGVAERERARAARDRVVDVLAAERRRSPRSRRRAPWRSR